MTLPDLLAETLGIGAIETSFDSPVSEESDCSWLTGERFEYGLSLIRSSTSQRVGRSVGLECSCRRSLVR